MSFIPYLQQPPTHTQTGTTLPSDGGPQPPTITLDSSQAAHAVTTDAVADPHGPRQWHSNLIKLSGKDRALNEFSVERIGERNTQTLVMLHGTFYRLIPHPWH